MICQNLKATAVFDLCSIRDPLLFVPVTVPLFVPVTGPLFVPVTVTGPLFVPVTVTGPLFVPVTVLFSITVHRLSLLFQIEVNQVIVTLVFSFQCSYGFIYDGDQLKVTCFQCRNSFCAQCKKPVSILHSLET